jgi:hypothetical protein
MIHNQELGQVETEAIGADEFWSLLKKTFIALNQRI